MKRTTGSEPSLLVLYTLIQGSSLSRKRGLGVLYLYVGRCASMYSVLNFVFDYLQASMVIFQSLSTNKNINVEIAS